MTESDDKPELDKVAELINKIEESSDDDKEKTIQFKNALNNLLKLAKKLITLGIKYDDKGPHIMYKDKNYYFYKIKDRRNITYLDIYESHIDELKYKIPSLENKEDENKEDENKEDIIRAWYAIDIIKRFRSISVVSPVYSQNINNSLYREYSLYYDVLAEVQNEQESKGVNGGRRISKGKSNKVAKNLLYLKRSKVYIRRFLGNK